MGEECTPQTVAKQLGCRASPAGEGGSAGWGWGRDGGGAVTCALGGEAPSRPRSEPSPAKWLRKERTLSRTEGLKVAGTPWEDSRRWRLGPSRGACLLPAWGTAGPTEKWEQKFGGERWEDNSRLLHRLGSFFGSFGEDRGKCPVSVTGPAEATVP